MYLMPCIIYLYIYTISTTVNDMIIKQMLLPVQRFSEYCPVYSVLTVRFSVLLWFSIPLYSSTSLFMQFSHCSLPCLIYPSTICICFLCQPSTSHSHHMTSPLQSIHHKLFLPLLHRPLQFLYSFLICSLATRLTQSFTQTPNSCSFFVSTIILT